jgi:hypothetical protein
MTRGEKTFLGAVFGLTWLFIIGYGSYNIGASIARHEWPKPMIILGGVVIVLGVALVSSWAAIDQAAWRRNAQKTEKPAAPRERLPAQKAPPQVTYSGNSVYVQDPPKTPSS